MADEAKQSALRDVVRDASLLREKRKQLDLLRTEHNREWALNDQFFKGNQWVFWNKAMNAGVGGVESLGVDDGDKPRYKVRLTNNLVTPGVQQLVAQMTKTRPTIRATPDSGADRDIKAAELAERLYEYWWQSLDLGGKLKTALTEAQISQGYWLISWDALAGKSMRIMVDPETGEPVTDEALADLYRDEIEQQAKAFGIDPMAILGQVEQTLYMGDIKVQPLSGQQVWIDPIPKNYEDAMYVFVRVTMDVDEIEARYGKKVTPDTAVSDERPTLMYTQQKDERPKNARDIFIGYFRPSPIMPKGRYVCWIEGPNEILEQSDWEFPFTELPIIKFPGLESPNSTLDTPRTSLVRPLQKELNNTISKVAMHKNLTLKPQMVAPIGSLQQRLTDEPGAVFEFAPIQGMAPEWRPIPSLPSHIFEYIAMIRTEIDRRFNLMPTERSQLPQRADSGQLVEIIQEAVADQISPEIQRMESALARAGNIMAALAQKFYVEPRLLKIRGAGGSIQVKKFMAADLAGGFSFHAEAGSGLPRTRAGQVQQIRELIEMGVLPPQEALPYLPIAGLKAIQARLMRDEEFAQRRIETLLSGQPVNEMAVQEALAQIQTGINPQTGELFQSRDEAIAYAEMASLQPLPYENIGKTLEVLGDHMKSVEFEHYQPELKQRFVQHYGLLKQGAMSLPNNADVKVSLGLSGTVGPTVAAEILRDKGIIGATPQTMAEPPLETSVYDSVDKPDADSAGNDPLTQAEQMQSLELNAADHAAKTARTAADMSLAQQRSAHAQELHDQKLRHTEEAHQERVRQMKQPAKEPVSG